MSKDQAEHAAQAAESAGASPATASQEEFKLPIAGFQGTPEEIERQWFEKVYKGRGDSMLQLTARAVIMGSLLGGILSLTNLYIGLKAGFGFGVAITACIMSYAIWTSLHALRIVKTKMTVLENNCMQSTASAAGFSTGGTLVSAFAAFVMINNQHMPYWMMICWVFFVAVLGVTMAVPMKRQMINIEQLRFPGGIAAAETLHALHSFGKKGIRAAKALGIAGALAAIDKFWADGLVLINASWAKFSSGAIIGSLNKSFLSKDWMSRTVMLVWDPIFIAAGAIVGFRVSTSILLGGTLCWFWFIPLMQHHGIVTDTTYRGMVQWTLWAGAACMVTSGLVAFVLQWKTAMRAFSNIGAMFTRRPSGRTSEMDAIETPGLWFVIGQVVSLIALCWLAYLSLGMPLWQTVLAVILAFVLSLVACRVTGETDVTPIGPLGKITQLIYGAISPGKMDINLMSANITSGAAASSADLLTDLKSGYLLGANPRKQFIAQFCGIFTGTLVTVTCFRLLVPDAASVGTDQFPAPAAQQWRAVAVALSEGLRALGPIKTWSIIIGGIVGIALALLPRFLKKYAKFIPSPAGLGLAWTIPWYYGLLFFIGALIGLIFEKKAPKQSEEFTFPIASGIIAGGAVMGVILIFWENGPEMLKQLIGQK